MPKPLSPPDGTPLKVEDGHPELPLPPPQDGRKRTRAPARPRRARPRRQTRTSAEPEPRGRGIRERINNFWDWVEAGGADVRGVSTLLYLWKQVGLKGLLPILLVIGFPLGGYSILSYATNSTVPTLAGDFGVSIEAEDWSYHPFALKTIAHNVRIRPKHQPGAQPVFTAAEVELKGDFGSAFSGLKELARSVVTVSWPTFHTFNQITIRHGALHLERSSTGHLNWSDYAESVPAASRRELLSGLYQIHGIVIDDLTINYVEHIAGNSGGGIIQTVQANVHVDGISGSITDITPARDETTLPTRVQLSGRAADGTIDLNGRIALVDQSTPASSGQIQRASLSSPSGSEGPYYDIAIALNNIGAAAFARTMPPTRIMATAGTLRGKVELRHRKPACVAEAAMHEVRFAPNPQLVPARAEFEQLQRELEHRVVSRPYKACDPLMPEANGPRVPGRPADRTRPASAVAFVAAFNEQANEDAPPAVRAAVAADSQNLTGRIVSAALSGMTDRIAGEIGRAASQRLGAEAGRVLQQQSGSRGGVGTRGSTPPAAQPQGDNPLAKGVKGIGHGLKRLFGRDKKDASPPPSKKKSGTQP